MLWTCPIKKTVVVFLLFLILQFVIPWRAPYWICCRCVWGIALTEYDSSTPPFLLFHGDFVKQIPKTSWSSCINCKLSQFVFCRLWAHTSFSSCAEQHPRGTRQGPLASEDGSGSQLAGSRQGSGWEQPSVVGHRQWLPCKQNHKLAHLLWGCINHHLKRIWRSSNS